MNYQHAYHAGCAADVFKHFTLMLLLKALYHKEAPLCYLETHAGLPYYDLWDKPSQATHEYQKGIARLFGQANLGPLLAEYCAIVKQLNQETEDLRYYPGSTLFAEKILRPQDRMVLTDSHPEVYAALKKYYARHANKAEVLQQDGYLSLKSLLPPQERRGVVLIDPPYEELGELAMLPDKISLGYKKWPTGIYAIWYPIKDKRLTDKFHHSLMKRDITKLLVAEFCPWPNDVPTRLNGSGLVIINPPWKLQEQLKENLPLLLQYLLQHPKGSAEIYML